MVKKKKKKIRVESDWKSYYGSNKELLQDVETYGKENFERIILRLCKTRGSCSYWEAYEQFISHAIPSDEFYNTWLSVRVRKDHLKNEDLK